MISWRFFNPYPLLIFTIYISLSFEFIKCAPPMFAYIPPPYYNPQPMMPHIPFSYPPFYNPHAMVPGMGVMGGIPSPYMNPGYMNPNYMNFGPDPRSIAAALNLPSASSASSQVGVSDENIAGQLGGAVQLSTVPKETSIPEGLLSAKISQPANPQVSASAIFPQTPNEPEKTAPLPKLY